MASPWRRLASDQRGLANGIIGFFAIIAIGALLFTLMDPALGEVFATSQDQASSMQASNAITERQEIWGAIPYYILFLAILFLFARSVYESGRV